jgi:hypothetical protein
VPTVQEGKFPRAASAMEKIAEHYGIPSIHMGIEVARLAKEGKLILKAKKPATEAERTEVGDKMIFSGDGVHPFPETGHGLYFQSILRSLPKIEAAGEKAGPHALTAPPFTADNYEQAKMVGIDRAKLSAGFVKLDPAKDAMAKRFANRLPVLYRAGAAGESVEFKFKGRGVAIYDLLAPDAGQVTIAIDGKPAVKRPRFDAYCTYARLGMLGIASDLPEGVHRVKVTVDGERLDKAKILSQRGEKMDDPKRFEDGAFYPGAILVVGDLVD